jgi:hypothetical protein
MTLNSSEVKTLHLKIRGQQKEVLTLRRSGVGTASAKLCWDNASSCGCAVHKLRQIS